MSGPSLVVWGGGETRALRSQRAEGALVVAWEGADTGDLTRAGVAFQRLEDVLGPDGLAAADAAGRGFARVWARLALAEGRSFRDLVSWRGDSLLWTCEGYLRESTAAPRCARTAELSLRLLAALQPREVDESGLPEAERSLLARACTVHGVLFHGRAASARALAPPSAEPAHGRWRAWLARLTPARQGGLTPDETPLLLALVPGSEERARLAPFLAALPTALRWRSLVLTRAELARRAPASARRAADEVCGRLRALHAELERTPALAASYAHRGVRFADLAARDLDSLLLLRLRHEVHRLEAAFALLEATRPVLLLVAALDRDGRRGLGLAAAAAGLPWVALRLLPREEDEPDRADGGPHPQAWLTLEPDLAVSAFAARLLEAARGRVGSR